MSRLFICIVIVASLASDSRSQDTTAAKPRKKHKLTDTVGVVNGAVIRLYDFRELLSDIMRSQAPDSVVQDTEFTRYVDMTWERLVSDILIQREIEKRKLVLSESQVIERLLREPPNELKQDFSVSGSFDVAAYEHFLESTEPDSTRTMVVNYFHMVYEQDNLMRALAPRAKSMRERTEAFAAWLRKVMKAARIEDRRTAFGYY